MLLFVRTLRVLICKSVISDDGRNKSSLSLLREKLSKYTYCGTACGLLQNVSNPKGVPQRMSVPVSINEWRKFLGRPRERGV